MNYQSFQRAAQATLEEARVSRPLTRYDLNLDRLRAAEESLERLIQLGQNLGPSEPIEVQFLKEELRKIQRLRGKLEYELEFDWQRGMRAMTNRG